MFIKCIEMLVVSSRSFQGDLHVVEDFSLSPELESAAAEVYKLANQRALKRVRLSQEGLLETSTEITDDLVVQRLQLAKVPEDDETEAHALSSVMIRNKEEAEEFLDLIKGGKAAEAAKLGLRSANYLRNLVDQRGWGPSVLFITE